MRTLIACLLILATACGDGFSEVQEADSIEAYEHYIASNPDSRFMLQATTRLEELFLEKAKASASLEGFDAYLERFPEGTYRAKALEEREQFLFLSAREANTPDAWTAYLTEYPKGDKLWRREAQRRLEVATYLPHLEIGEITQTRVNLADDPQGPLNGWGFEAPITNSGEQTLSRLSLALVFEDAEGHELLRKDWPVVAPSWGVPMEEERKVPMKPGETRSWTWSTGEPPEGWTDRVRLEFTQITAE